MHRPAPRRLILLTALLLVALPALVPTPISSSAAGDPLGQWMIELVEPPLADVYAELNADDRVGAAAASVTQRHLAAIEARQAALLTELERLGVAPLYRVQRAYNGVAVLAPAGRLDELTALPGVRGVHPLVPKRLDNRHSVPFIGAPSLWQGETGTGVHGEGITIAVIDTGVDYLHAAFGGSRSYSANDPTRIGDVPDFPGAKVTAGYDFAGDAYDADPLNPTYNPTPAPDPDPTDCYSHGTHVAATAAGFGVTEDGQTYTGPYDAAAAGPSFSIGPGVAPLAQIVALRIFGCQGSSSLTELAIDWALDPNGDGDLSDHVDVINMSLGSVYGALYDSTVVASNNAARAGVIVVASAGNDGDVTFAAAAPGIADRAVSVASIWEKGEGLSAASTGIQGVSSVFSSRGPRRGDAALKPDLAAPGEAIFSARPGDPGLYGYSSSGTSMAAPHVAGGMALLRQLHPDWPVEMLKALVINTARPQVQPDSARDSLLRIGSGVIDLAAAARAETSAFDADAPGLVSVSFGAPEVAESAVFTKSIAVANHGDETVRYTVTIETSLDMPGAAFELAQTAVEAAAGHRAELALRLRVDARALRHPRDPVSSDTQRLPRHWLSEETGAVRFWPDDNPFHATLAGTNAVPPAATEASGSARFDYDPQVRTLAYTISAQGLRAEQVTAVEIVRSTDAAAGSVAYPIALDGLAAGQPVMGTLTLLAADEPLLLSGLLHLRVTTLAWPAGELRGRIKAEKPVLSVPIYAAPRPVSSMRAAAALIDFADAPTEPQTLLLEGADLRGSEPPTDVVSLLSAFELRHISPELPAAQTGNLPAQADIQYVGLTGDSAEDAAADRMLYFGIAAYDDWSTPNEVRFDIFLDVNRDGVDDYRLFNSDALNVRSRFDVSDAFVAALEALPSEEVREVQLLNVLSTLAYDTRLFNSNVMVLPVRARDLGLTAEEGSFLYRIESTIEEGPEAVDRTPTLTFDLTHPALDLISGNNGAPLIENRDGAALAVSFNPAATRLHEVGGLLLFHHHNASGERTEVVSVRFGGSPPVYLPFATR